MSDLSPVFMPPFLKVACPLFLGFRMPAEWEPHEATWLAWPHNEETWPGKVGEVEEIYLQMIEALVTGEKVKLLVNDELERDRVEKKIRSRGINSTQVVYFLIPTVDTWIRDYGPSFVTDKAKVAWVRWRFNAWGGKYESLALDDGVPEALVPFLKMTRFSPGLILEGGSIDANGKGSLLVTEQCLLNPNRNPKLSRDDIEGTLRNFLGVSHMIWLGEGIEGDDTDGHVDDITRFVNPTTVVTAVEEDSNDRNFSPLDENLLRLQKATDQDGRRLAIVKMPMPDRVDAPWGRLPASYMNFYIANGVVLAPIFGQAKDRDALRILEELFPGRRMVGVRSETLVMGLGGIHCVTHEEPAAG